jgi:protein-L-isoaspartate(D-aspartate) O-methyltransferase
VDVISKAFSVVDRINFVPEDLKDRARLDSALPIGYGQTISQPYTVEKMLRWLEVEPGNKILDIGSGSGWTAALLSQLGGKKSQIYAVEIVPELVEFGRKNNNRLGIKNVKFYQAGKELGLPQHAPFDRILVSASADELPHQLLQQLKPGGKMVIPVREDILEIEKTDDKNYETAVHSGFVFVPLIN